MQFLWHMLSSFHQTYKFVLVCLDPLRTETSVCFERDFPFAVSSPVVPNLGVVIPPGELEPLCAILRGMLEAVTEMTTS